MKRPNRFIIPQLFDFVNILLRDMPYSPSYPKRMEQLCEKYHLAKTIFIGYDEATKRSES